MTGRQKGDRRSFSDKRRTGGKKKGGIFCGEFSQSAMGGESKKESSAHKVENRFWGRKNPKTLRREWKHGPKEKTHHPIGTPRSSLGEKPRNYRSARIAGEGGMRGTIMRKEKMKALDRKKARV